MVKKATVAGSKTEPAIQAAAVAAFPRDVQLINQTAMEYVVARVHVMPNTKATVRVNDEDEITRIKTDCEQIMSISDHYRDAEVSPLRVEEIAALPVEGAVTDAATAAATE